MRINSVILPVLFIFLFISISSADYDDGYITAGEYEYGVEWFSDNPPLIVDGGGADIIGLKSTGQLQVRSTSTPLQWNVGGIIDIWLDDFGTLTYLGGLTEEITITENATAVLKGGSIVGITSLQYAITTHIDLYCQPGWSWEYTGQNITGITGLWMDGTAFDIMLINDDDYDPTWMNINVITPEPATLALLATGAILLRRKNKPCGQKNAHTMTRNNFV